jgi:hypothetical protein
MIKVGDILSAFYVSLNVANRDTVTGFYSPTGRYITATTGGGAKMVAREDKEGRGEVLVYYYKFKGNEREFGYHGYVSADQVAAANTGEQSGGVSPFGLTFPSFLPDWLPGLLKKIGVPVNYMAVVAWLLLLFIVVFLLFKIGLLTLGSRKIKKGFILS